jgi:hypothetical protein
MSHLSCNEATFYRYLLPIRLLAAKRVTS